MPPVALVRFDELRPEVGVQVRVHYWDYAVWRLADGSVRVLDNACLHIGGPLVDGAVKAGCVICPWHGWRYDLATGEHQTAFGPRPGVVAHRAWVEDGTVFADLPADRLG